VPLRYNTLHITPHYTTHHTTLHYTLHYTTLHITPHYTTHYTTLHYTLHHTTLLLYSNYNILLPTFRMSISFAAKSSLAKIDLTAHSGAPRKELCARHLSGKHVTKVQACVKAVGALLASFCSPREAWSSVCVCVYVCVCVWVDRQRGFYVCHTYNVHMHSLFHTHSQINWSCTHVCCVCTHTLPHTSTHYSVPTLSIWCRM
jgi:hypothetical protein